jgi:hypothetical protein
MFDDMVDDESEQDPEVELTEDDETKAEVAADLEQVEAESKSDIYDIFDGVDDWLPILLSKNEGDTIATFTKNDEQIAVTIVSKEESESGNVKFTIDANGLKMSILSPEKYNRTTDENTPTETDQIIVLVKQDGTVTVHTQIDGTVDTYQPIEKEDAVDNESEDTEPVVPEEVEEDYTDETVD